MSTTVSIILAGFGGQGILFAGKLLAYKGLLEDKKLSWLPSYGPEMRGGTANCSVCLSDEPIASPLVVAPNVLIAMNQPSLEKFIDRRTDLCGFLLGGSQGGEERRAGLLCARHDARP